MRLYADEDCPKAVTIELRRLGHDIITAQEDGLASSPDPVILARSHSLGRIVVTRNRWDYERLHRQGAPHSGIVSTTQDLDHIAVAGRVDAALVGSAPGRWCLRVNKLP